MAVTRPASICTYCGGPADTRDHVIPRGLYPRDQRSGLITVPACAGCNGGWSDDEPHFRGAILLSGEATPMATEVWNGPVLRSFDKEDGQRRRRELAALVERIQTDQGERGIIRPLGDPRVLCVLRKIVRGLARYHGLPWPVPEGSVGADVLRYQVPPAFAEEMRCHGAVRTVASYGYVVFPESEEPEAGSIWSLTFYERTTFVAWINRAT